MSTVTPGNGRSALVVGLLIATMFGSGVVMLIGIPTPDRVAAARHRGRRRAAAAQRPLHRH